MTESPVSYATISVELLEPLYNRDIGAVKPAYLICRSFRWRTTKLLGVLKTIQSCSDLRPKTKATFWCVRLSREIFSSLCYIADLGSLVPNGSEKTLLTLGH